MTAKYMLRQTVAGLGLLAIFAGCVATEQVPAGRSLHARIGGQPVISVVVEQCVANVLADTRINGRFATTDIRKLKGQLVDHLCMATGGPCIYSGRDMKTTHVGMRISTGDVSAFVEDLVKAMDIAKVPMQEKGEILGLLGSMKKDIIEVP
ncbi:MAG: group 1 truncated hemoglobin [Nitrospirota bacterium]|nr:group 1 truncated hemoglobin [Nitrospirota bacterium]MDP2383852.1 group 1 truncated hemoglobin [Nitrospirota bacterium]MDP3599427.1 group 1 truncated hemoglobin [Nitrospirota bacterium]